MPRKRSAGLPSRKQILDFIATSDQPAGKREIARAFGLHGNDKIGLKTNPAEMPLAKSYINCTEDVAMPHSHPWHPRLSEKLGLFRLVQVPGSHELCFSDPARLARAIMEAGRD